MVKFPVNNVNAYCPTCMLWYVLSDDDLVKVETCRRDISDKLLFIIYCAWQAVVSVVMNFRVP